MSKTTQYDQVIAVVEKLGGIAKLSQLYAKVDFSGWDTKTPLESIRRIAQDKKRFYRVNKGLYCLRERRSEFAEIYDETSGDSKAIMSNHSYYQGLLLELGRMQGLTTYVAHHDRGRNFLRGESLGNMSDWDNLPDFGYPHLMKDAKTVDVIWFNRRKMPSVFYEVEMTTDMSRSLAKFHMLQDFYADLLIVAPTARRRMFDNILQNDMHREICKRVCFRSTESVATEIDEIARKARNLLIRDA